MCDISRTVKPYNSLAIVIHGKAGDDVIGKPHKGLRHSKLSL